MRTVAIVVGLPLLSRALAGAQTITNLTLNPTTIVRGNASTGTAV